MDHKDQIMVWRGKQWTDIFKGWEGWGAHPFGACAPNSATQGNMMINRDVPSSITVVYSVTSMCEVALHCHPSCYTMWLNDGGVPKFVPTGLTRFEYRMIIKCFRKTICVLQCMFLGYSFLPCAVGWLVAVLLSFQPWPDQFLPAHGSYHASGLLSRLGSWPGESAYKYTWGERRRKGDGYKYLEMWPAEHIHLWIVSLRQNPCWWHYTIPQRSSWWTPPEMGFCISMGAMKSHVKRSGFTYFFETSELEYNSVSSVKYTLIPRGKSLINEPFNCGCTHYNMHANLSTGISHSPWWMSW